MLAASIDIPLLQCRPISVVALLLTIIVCMTSSVSAQQQLPAPENKPEQDTNALLIEQLASASDLIAIARVSITSYKYRRGFPISGYADLDILVPYKMQQRRDSVRVVDEGLGKDKCYFPQTFPGEEGSRFLVFLAEHTDGDYRGHPLACKLSVLVTDEYDYALRYPLADHVRLTETQREWVQPMQFSDPFATTGGAELTPGRKQALAEQIEGDVVEGGAKYTQGIPISRFSELIGRENIIKPDQGGKY